MPDWDKNLQMAWDYIKNHKLNHIKVVGQLPGGIKQISDKIKINGINAKLSLGYIDELRELKNKVLPNSIPMPNGRYIQKTRTK